MRRAFILLSAALLFSCGKSKTPAPSSSNSASIPTPQSADLPASISSGQPPLPAPAPQTPAAPPPIVASPQETWHGKTDAEHPLFAYLYAEDTRASTPHIRVLAASLIYPGPHQIDITYQRDPAGPEENIQTVDFANLPNVDGLRWSLNIDGSPQAHGKYPQTLTRFDTIIDGPSGPLHPEQEAAVVAEVPHLQNPSLQSAIAGPDHLFLWLRLQSAPGWHGDAPAASDPAASPNRSPPHTPDAAARILETLEAFVEHRSALSPVPSVTDAGNMDLIQAAPLLDLLWTDPAQQNNDPLRKQIIVAAAQIGQPLDILQQAAAGAPNPLDRIQAAIGLMRQGDADAHNIPLDYAKAYLDSGPNNFNAVTSILTKCIDPDIRAGIQSLTSHPNAAAHAAQFQAILTAIDDNLLPVDQLITRASTNAASDPAGNFAIFQALGERASPNDIPLLQQIPPSGLSSAKINAIARITQRFWREPDRIPAALPVPGAPSDNSMP